MKFRYPDNLALKTHIILKKLSFDQYPIPDLWLSITDAELARTPAER